MNSLFPTVKAPVLWDGKASTLPKTHMQYNKTIGDPDPKAVECSAAPGVQRDQSRRAEASGDKNSFFRIMDLTSHTLLKDCFCNFIDIHPLMSVE